MHKFVSATALAVVLSVSAAHAQNVGTGAKSSDTQFNSGGIGAYLNIDNSNPDVLQQNEQSSAAVGNEAIQDVRNQADVAASGDFATRATGASAAIESDNRGNAITGNTMSIAGATNGSFTDNEQEALSFGNSASQSVRNDETVSTSFSITSSASGATASANQLNTGATRSSNSMVAGEGAITDNTQAAQSTGNAASQSVRNDGETSGSTTLTSAMASGAGASAAQTNTGNGSASNTASSTPNFANSSFSVSSLEQSASVFGNTGSQEANNFANIEAGAGGSSASGAATSADQTNRGDQSASNLIENPGGPGAQGHNNTQLAVALGNNIGQDVRNTGAVTANGPNGTVGAASAESSQLNADNNQSASNTINASNSQFNEQSGLAFGNQAVQEVRNDGAATSASGPSAVGANASVSQVNTGNQATTGTINSEVYTNDNAQSAISVGNLADTQVQNTASGIVDVD